MKLKCPLGLSSCNKEINEELFRLYREAGIQVMEISKRYKELENIDLDEVYRLSKKYDVKLNSFHIPFVPFNYIEPSREDVAEQTIEIAKNYIRKGSEIGIKIFVIHASGEPIEEEERSKRIERAKKTLYEIAEYAKSLGAVIAVEDLPRTCLGNRSSELLEILTAHPDLKVCFDTNHLLGENLVDFVKAVGDKIVTTHVSDYDYIDERHWLPGEGLIDWSALTTALKEVGYNGAWVYEIDFESPSSLNRGRNLTCQDFKNNYDEIMDGKSITIIKNA